MSAQISGRAHENRSSDVVDGDGSGGREAGPVVARRRALPDGDTYPRVGEEQHRQRWQEHAHAIPARKQAQSETLQSYPGP